MQTKIHQVWAPAKYGPPMVSVSKKQQNVSILPLLSSPVASSSSSTSSAESTANLTENSEIRVMSSNRKMPLNQLQMSKTLASSKLVKFSKLMKSKVQNLKKPLLVQKLQIFEDLG